MTKKMSASVRDKKTGETLVINSEYSSKSEFRAELNGNGYAVIGSILIEGEKNQASDHGMTTREYKIRKKHGLV